MQFFSEEQKGVCSQSYGFIVLAPHADFSRVPQWKKLQECTLASNLTSRSEVTPR
jgi:hypothetical protein